MRICVETETERRIEYDEELTDPAKSMRITASSVLGKRKRTFNDGNASKKAKLTDLFEAPPRCKFTYAKSASKKPTKPFNNDNSTTIKFFNALKAKKDRGGE